MARNFEELGDVLNKGKEKAGEETQNPPAVEVTTPPPAAEVQTPPATEQPANPPASQDTTKIPEFQIELKKGTEVTTDDDVVQQYFLKKLDQVTNGKVKNIDELNAVINSPGIQYANEKVQMLDAAARKLNDRPIDHLIHLIETDPEKSDAETLIRTQMMVQYPQMTSDEITSIIETTFSASENASEKERKAKDAEKKLRAEAAKKFVSEFKQSLLSGVKSTSTEEYVKAREQQQKNMEAWHNAAAASLSNMNELVLSMKIGDKEVPIKYKFTDQDKKEFSEAVKFENLMTYQGPFWEMYKDKNDNFDFDLFGRHFLMLKNLSNVLNEFFKTAAMAGKVEFVDSKGKAISLGATEKSNNTQAPSLESQLLDWLKKTPLR